MTNRLCMNFLIPNSRVVGAAPLFRQMADDIGLVDMVNRSVLWDARQFHVSPGERLLVMVLDLLLGKSPLYRDSAPQIWTFAISFTRIRIGT